jgi:hypothetical protein
MGRFLHDRPSSALTLAHLRTRASLPACYRAAIVDRWVPPVSSLFPQIFPPLLRACISSPAKFLLMGQPPVTTPRHKAGRMFTCHLEPLCQLRWAVVSHSYPLLYCCPLLLQLGCPHQELDDEASRRLPYWLS